MARFFGTETEYGIATPTEPMLSPIVTATHAVLSYQEATKWDFAAEAPLRDRRGFDLRRHRVAPEVDPTGIGAANLVTTSGARFYVDHAHPEYSAPETTNPFDAMVYDQAGDLLLQRAVEAVAEHTERGESAVAGHSPCPALKIYKNNVDGKGASYGSHENYCYSRETDFDVLAQALIPFFVTRQIFTGAGRVGLGVRGEEPGFQISQRADYIEQEISLETTLNRGIINTRDEPHTSDPFARLHVIIGDANYSQTATFLKLGTTGLVLDVIEAGETFADLALADPVADVRRVSRDLDTPLKLKDGRALTARELQYAYLERCAGEDGVDTAWREILDRLERPLDTADTLDWTAKLALLQGFRKRGLDWDDPKMQLVDLQYADVSPSKSLYRALVAKGKMRTLVDDAAVLAAVTAPPKDTRAWFRGAMLRRFPAEVQAANWSYLVVGDQRVGTEDLGALTEADAAPYFRSTAAETIEALAEAGKLTVTTL